MALARRVCVATALAIASVSATARAEYAVIDLGALINTATGTNASVRGINAAAQVAITNAPDALAYHAYQYSAGASLDLGTLGGNAAFALAINNAGQVAGRSVTTAGTVHAFIWTPGGVGGIRTPLAINNQDQIVGYSANLDGSDRAFLYKDAAMTDLGTLGGRYSYALAINGSNQIAGGSYTDDADSIYHAFLSDGTTMTDLNSKVTSKAANWILNEAKGINDSGVIIGTGALSGQSHAFMLRPLAPGDATADGAVDFNDLVALAQNYNTSGSVDWEHGDFTGDGNVDFNELLLLPQKYNTTQFQSDVQAAFAAVPEPSAFSALTIASLLAI